MSRHSKWAKIKRSKAVTDSKRGKIFTRHAKLIAVAARGGGDIDMNPTLRSAVDNARADNMPFDNIQRAIKKGTGEAKAGTQIEEVIYEGFAQGGVAVLMQALTDNRNRTITNLKIIMGRNGGTMGAAGSVNYLFERQGLVSMPIGEKSIDEIELAAIDAGAIDVKPGDDQIDVFTAQSELQKVKDALKKAGYKCGSSDLVFVPVTEVEIEDEDVAEKILSLVEILEEDDDVVSVYTNMA